MQLWWGKLFKIYQVHIPASKIGSSAPYIKGTDVSNINTTCFSFKEGSCHGHASQPCNCVMCQTINNELFTAMVCSRLLSSRMISNATKSIRPFKILNITHILIYNICVGLSSFYISFYLQKGRIFSGIKKDPFI